MSNGIGEYLISVVATAVLLSLVQAFLPKGTVKKVAGYIGGLLVVLAVLSPVVKVEPEEISRSASRIRRQTREITLQAETGNQELMARIINDNCRTYILDKANERGIDLQVEITMGTQEGYPVPVAVILTGTVTSEQKLWLTEVIYQGLGIPAQRQEWKTD